MNHSPIYSRFEDTKDLILDEQLDLWNERFEEVSHKLYSSNRVGVHKMRKWVIRGS